MGRVDGADATSAATAGGDALAPPPASSPASRHGPVLNDLPSDTRFSHVLSEIGANGVAQGGRSRSSSSPLRASLPHEPTAAAPGTATTRRKSTLAPLDVRKASKPEIMKLSPAQILDLTEAPDSLPVRPASPVPDDLAPLPEARGRPSRMLSSDATPHKAQDHRRDATPRYLQHAIPNSAPARPSAMPRSASIPTHPRREKLQPTTEPLRTPSPSVGLGIRQRPSRKHTLVNERRIIPPDPRMDPPPSPALSPVPLPPPSLPTYLQLELSSDRPSPLYIHRSPSSDVSYESSKVKFERLLNFLRLPPYLEQILFFGALACLDSWLYTFTVLPLRFAKSLWLLLLWAGQNVGREVRELGCFVYQGVGRLWRRARGRQSSANGFPPPVEDFHQKTPLSADNVTSHRRSRFQRHRRNKSLPSNLQENHKADLLQGLLIITSCMLLTRFDASRMYHNVRGQAAIKLYVIYNVLEVCDRLFSAVGQDILECLFSKETLERNPDGRSKIFRPLWMFILALAYTVIHATALFYQVITLNVAVNSYSNALLTLLMSNQFVEIKGAVFKKFEKENLFQLTCADIVERFQLWIMLLVIALRNIVEVGGLSINTRENVFTGPSSFSSTSTDSANPAGPNATNPVSSTFGILPDAFTLMPSLNSFQVLSPFVMVLGSEMLVDWLKHAYITKFNATSPRIYARFLDILAKDYYSHAFVDQNLTRRLGLPVLPLACLFIRASLQTYHMFLATNISSQTLSPATSLSLENEAPTSSPVLAQIDQILRRALGHSSFGGGSSGDATRSWLAWSVDDVIALTTMLLFFLALYLLLLALKLALGMVLLGFARNRYKGMKQREQERFVETQATRLGGWGVTEVGEERRRLIYDEAPEELSRLREKESKAKRKEESGQGVTKGLEGVERYAMVAKRIW